MFVNNYPKGRCESAGLLFKELEPGCSYLEKEGNQHGPAIASQEAVLMKA
jgi:hypothetical protein